MLVESSGCCAVSLSSPGPRPNLSIQRLLRSRDTRPLEAVAMFPGRENKNLPPVGVKGGNRISRSFSQYLENAYVWTVSLLNASHSFSEWGFEVLK